MTAGSMLDRLAARGRIKRRARLVRAALVPKRPRGLYCITPGYVERLDPEYDYEENWGDARWQPDVYRRGAEIALSLHLSRIVDVGCGNGNKVSQLKGFETVGIDFGPNLKVCRTRYPDSEWVEHDVDSEEPFPVPLEDTLVLCADVIEHVLYPERLLRKLRSARLVVLSTPERDLHWGVSHMGPPPNRAHVREWNRREFRAFLASEGYVGTIELTRSRDRPPLRNTILAITSNSPKSQ